MSRKSLEDLLKESGGPVEHLRDSQSGPNPYPGDAAPFGWR
jgi:hypothetical protein